TTSVRSRHEPATTTSRLVTNSRAEAVAPPQASPAMQLTRKSPLSEAAEQPERGARGGRGPASGSSAATTKGGVVSTTVIVCVQEAASVASAQVQVRSMVRVPPQPRVSRSVNVHAGSEQKPLVEGSPVAGGSVAPGHSTMAPAGHVACGSLTRAKNPS